MRANYSKQMTEPTAEQAYEIKSNIIKAGACVCVCVRAGENEKKNRIEADDNGMARKYVCARFAVCILLRNTAAATVEEICQLEEKGQNIRTKRQKKAIAARTRTIAGLSPHSFLPTPQTLASRSPPYVCARARARTCVYWGTCSRVHKSITRSIASRLPVVRLVKIGAVAV